MTEGAATAVEAGTTGPVTAALEAELRSTVLRHGVVLWLDADGHYAAMVDRLQAARAAGALPYAVQAFRGSHLKLMLALDGVAGGTDKVPLLLHLPGFNEETVGETPCLELYEAGTRYRKALPTLVAEAAAGRVPPGEIAAFIAQPALTLDAADAWLAQRVGDDGAGIAAELRSMTPASVLDDLLRNGHVASRLRHAEDAAALWRCLSAQLGLTAEWRALALPGGSRLGPDDVAYAAASWALGVEYVDDLRRPPVNAHLAPARELPRAVIDACRALATHLRDHHAAFYVRTADETEVLLDDEVRAARAEDLGQIDTFQFEEEKVFQAAMVAVEAGHWETAREWAERRVGSGTAAFWLRDQLPRQAAWRWIGDAARLGLAIVQAGSRLGVEPSDDGWEAAIEAYVQRGAAVDRAHRHLEQARSSLLHAALPEYAQLRRCHDATRRVWRQWADAWARDFNALCRHRGFLPPAGLQQRTLFDDVIRPLVSEAGTTAYFVVDALRFEMGAELLAEMQELSSTTSSLKARLAELPTVTEVGMNALAPVVQGGRMKPVRSGDGGGFAGFQCGEFRVSDPATRKRAMQDRVGGSTCPWLALDDVLNRDTTSLRRAIAQARLVVIHSRELDVAGENDFGPALFGQVLQQLRTAWRLLREAGVRRFVFTGDHGFLLLDDSAGAVQAHGRKTDPKRRHVFSPVAADHAGEVRVALSELGYEGVEGHVMFPETTAVFDCGGRAPTYVHGGNSLQERVIPVLTVVHRAQAGGSAVRHAIEGRLKDGVAGLHCLELRVVASDQAPLQFGGALEVDLALRVDEVPGVVVDLCQTRGAARIQDGVVFAKVGEWFEVFFRLSSDTDSRVRVEVHHSGAVAEVTSWSAETRFAVTSRPGLRTTPGALANVVAPNASWLESLADAGVRRVFAHLAEHGTVTEEEVMAILGGARAARRFARHFEEHAARAPFTIRIAEVGGLKRYVREGPN